MSLKRDLARRRHAVMRARKDLRDQHQRPRIIGRRLVPAPAAPARPDWPVGAPAGSRRPACARRLPAAWRSHRPAGVRPVGSALMMLTGGIEADDGKKRPLGAVLGEGARGGSHGGRIRRRRGRRQPAAASAQACWTPPWRAPIAATRWRDAGRWTRICARSDFRSPGWYRAAIRTRRIDRRVQPSRSASTCATMPKRSVSIAWRRPPSADS